MDMVESEESRVSEADALGFLDTLVPQSPRSSSPVVLVDDVEAGSDALSDSQVTARLPSIDAPAESLPTQPPLPPPLSLSSAAIAINGTPPSALSQRPASSASSRFQGGTITSTLSIYHTPSSSFFDQFHSTRASPEASVDAHARQCSASTSPERFPWTTASASSGSSGSALTVTPSLFGQSTINGHSITTATTTVPFAVSRVPDRYPRVFFTSAKTGAGVAEVFEYVVRRVVKKWEYEEALDARTMHIRETSNSDTIRLGLAGANGRQGRKGEGRMCCAA